MSLHDHVIATVGTGVMAESMLSGLLESGAITPDRIIASHPRGDRRDALGRTLGVRTTGSNTEAVAAADIVVLGIKPQMLKSVGKELAPVLRPEQLVISILAGPTSTALANALPLRVRTRWMSRDCPGTTKPIAAPVSGAKPPFPSPRSTSPRLSAARPISGLKPSKLPATS